MTVRPDEVASIIKREIEKYEDKLKMESVGTVLQVGDGVARIYGLDDCMSNELLEFPGGIFGIALNLEEDNVGCVLLGSDKDIKEGDTVKTTGNIVEVPVGEALLGRVVNALGQPLDGKGPIATEKTENSRILLVQDCIHQYCRFTCLPVTYYQFSLSPAYWYHSINSLYPGL